VAARKRTFAEAQADTHAIRALRGGAPKRVARAKREALAPRAPDAAVRAYASVMSTHAERTRALVERHVLTRLPVLGSGDPLDLTALDDGIQQLHAELEHLASRVRRSARAAATRVSAHGRAEVGRVMRMQVPLDARAAFTIEAFENQQVDRLRRVARAQVEQIRKAIRTYAEGQSMRERILHSLWVTRNRGQVLARSECYQLHNQIVQEWAVSVGSEGGFYCTRQDELVRAHHAEHDGKYYRWGETPSTLGEPNCRCRMLPAEAPELQ
jgi:uncharacterized protein with gpF-like domain